MNSLQKIYHENKANLNKVRESSIGGTLTGPLLMELCSYYKQPVKLFIIGQETKGWCCDYNNHQALFDNYKNFNMGEKYYSSPFWNITRKIENIIGITPYSCAWSNINRYAYNKGEPKGEILKAIQSLDCIVAEEILSIQPDICLFFANRKYDFRLQTIYPTIQMKAIDNLPFNHFVQLCHPSLPKYSFRTPHPRTIRCRKWENAFLEAMAKILPKATDSQLKDRPNR